MFPFDPPENIWKPLVFLCFQGNQKGTLGRKGLMILKIFISKLNVKDNFPEKNLLDCQ